MKDYMKIYQEWLANPYFDDKTKEELRAIANDENEIKERFYMDLEFGTAGLRGIIGAGINRSSRSHPERIPGRKQRLFGYSAGGRVSGEDEGPPA